LNQFSKTLFAAGWLGVNPVLFFFSPFFSSSLRPNSSEQKITKKVARIVLLED